MEKDYDTFLPVSTCKYIKDYQLDRNTTEQLLATLDQQYSVTLAQFTAAMKSLDPTHAKDSYTAIDLIRYFENIYARTFHGQILSGFSPDLVTSMQKV